MKLKTEHLPGIPVPVFFRRNRRARRIVVTTEHNCVKVSVPLWNSYSQARDFVVSIATKINSNIKELTAKGVDTQRDVNMRLARMPVEAKKLADRFVYLAKKYGFKYKKLTIRNQRTMWGSCSSSGNISINIALAELPGDLRDYVILHELVHTKHPNHSKRFWKELDKYTLISSKITDRKLRDYRITQWW
ncbi:M48 family metallopeptidase [Limihaloglobus sulfuriphilus]|nr:M48 family metallopeptidase [Limihaloglobus sulfuriphilus]